MPPSLRKASERLSTWVDEVRGQLSHVACCDDLTAALVSFMQHAAKVARAVSFPGDDSSEEQRQQLSKDLLAVLYEICSHLHLRSRDFLASSGCWGQFAYWEHQSALLSYALDVGIICSNLKQAISRVCYILLKNRHLVWDVLVRTRAISTSREALEVYQKLAAWCPRSCADDELYFKFVVCAVCVARQHGPASGWQAVKCTVLSIEPAAFDFREWFSARPALVALLPASSLPKSGPKLIAALCNGALDVAELLRTCRDMTVSRGAGSCIRSACDAAADEQDMFSFVDDHSGVAPESEEAAAAPKVEDHQLRGILDWTLHRIPSAIVSPRATDTEPNSELISEAASSSLRITDSFLRTFLGSPSPERASVAGKRAQEFVRPSSPRPVKRRKRESTSVEDPGGSKGDKTAARDASEDGVPAVEDADPSKDADGSSPQRERSSGAKSGAHGKMTAGSSHCTSADSSLQASDVEVLKTGDQTGTTSDCGKRLTRSSMRRTPTSNPELAEGATQERHQDQDAGTAPTHRGTASITATSQKTRNLPTKKTPRQQELSNGERRSSNDSSGSEDSVEVVSVVRGKGPALTQISNGTGRRRASKNAARLAVTSSSEAESGTETEEAALPRRRKSRVARKLPSTTSEDSAGPEDKSEDESEDESEEGAAETASRQHRKPCRAGQNSDSKDADSAEEVSEGLPVPHQTPDSGEHPSLRHGVQSRDGSEAESTRGSSRDSSPQSHKSSSSPKLLGRSDSASDESEPGMQRRSVRPRKAKVCVISDSSEQESCDEKVVEVNVADFTSHEEKTPEVGSSQGGSDPGGKLSRCLRSSSSARNARKSTTSNGKATDAKGTQQTDSNDSSATNDSSESESCDEMVVRRKRGEPSALELQNKRATLSSSDEKSGSEISPSRRASCSSVDVSTSCERKVHPCRVVDSSEEDLWEDEAVRGDNEKLASSSESVDEIPCGQRSPVCSQQQSTQGSSSVPLTGLSQSSTPSNTKTGTEECEESSDSRSSDSSDSEAAEEGTRLPVLQQRQKITASSGSSIELDGKASNRFRASRTSREHEAKSSPSRPCSKEDSNDSSPARKSCRNNPASSKQQEYNEECVGSSSLKEESAHNVLNVQQDASLSPRETVASTTVYGKPARELQPKRKSVMCDTNLNASNSADSQNDHLAVESEADTVNLSADDEPLSLRKRCSSLSQASTVIVSPERRSLSSQREKTPAVGGEMSVAAPSGSEKRPSEERPVFKLPQPLETAKSSTSALPSGSDNVCTSADGMSSAAKETSSRGSSSHGEVVLANEEESAATDASDFSKSGSDEDVTSDGSASSLSTGQSSLTPGPVARAMPATGDSKESASFSEQSISTGLSAVKQRQPEGMRDTEDVILDVDARHTRGRLRQDFPQSSRGLKSESKAAGLRKKQPPFSKRRSPPLLHSMKKTMREGIAESSQSDSDDASTNRSVQRGPVRRSRRLKTGKSSEAGPVAGVSNRSMRLERNSERASDDTDDEDRSSGCSGSSSSREQEDREVDPKAHRSKQTPAIEQPAAKSPQEKRQTVGGKKSVTESGRESTGEDTAGLEMPNKHSSRVLSNGKMQSSSVSWNENQSSSSSDEEEVPPSKLASATMSARKRRLTRKAADSMPQGTPFARAASRNANESSSSSGPEPLSKLGSAVISTRKRQLPSKGADSMPLETPSTKAAGAVLNTKSTAKGGKELFASRMTSFERERTTESQDSDSEPTSTGSKSSSLKQTRAGSADECSNTRIPSVGLQCSTPRVHASNGNGLLQTEVLSSSERIPAMLFPGSNSLDIGNASAACSSLTYPSTSRRLFAGSVGREHAVVPGHESAAELGQNMTPSQASDNLNGLTQKPHSSFASSGEQRSNLRSSARRRLLRKHQSPETMEQFVIDYDEQVPPSFTDTDSDDDPLFEVQRSVNIAIAAADFDRSGSSLPSPPKRGKQTPQNAPPSNDIESEKSVLTRGGRLSLAAIRAKAGLSPAATNNVANNVTVTPSHSHRNEGDGCQRRREQPEKSVRDQAEKRHDGVAVSAGTGVTPNAPVPRRSLRISRRLSGCASARATRSSAEPTSAPQVTPPSGRSGGLGLVNEEAESTPANKASPLRQASRWGNVETAVKRRRSGRDADSTPGVSPQSLNEDSSNAGDSAGQVTPVKVVAERIEAAFLRAQSRCFTCSSCSRSFSETTPRMRDSETMTDESLFRQGEAPSPVPGPSKRRKESGDNSSSPARSESAAHQSSSARRGRPAGRTGRETSQQREEPTVSRKSGAATGTLLNGLRLRRLQQTVTVPRRPSCTQSTGPRPRRLRQMVTAPRRLSYM